MPNKNNSSSNNSFLKFWAKTTHDKDKYPNAYHPLICHLIDVAVVTKKIWVDVLPKATKERINEKFGVKDAGNLIAFIAGLHDLGKCSPPFTLRGIGEVENKDWLEKQLANQSKKDSFYADRIFRRLQTIYLLELYRKTDFWISGVKKASAVPHGYVTAVELPEILSDKFDFNRQIAKQISTMIGGHHGVFPSTGKIREIEDWDKASIGGKDWKKARRELVDELNGLFKPDDFPQNLETKLDNGTIMILAGLVSVADWIGSDVEFFKSAAEYSTDNKIKLLHGSLENYLKHAENQAEVALLQLGWIHKKNKNESDSSFQKITDEKKFEKLFPLIKNRRHLQDMAIEISKELDKPGIAVIEAPTGEGKTEAAMFLADAWNNRLDQTGYYFALPTQATSNQMFGRAKEFLENRFPDSNVNVQLTHGHASLSGEFDTLKKEHKKIIKGIYDDQCVGDECVPSVVAAEWFTYRKRSLLAPFGIGTIDQALMAVLQTKHVFVRLFGLAHKTIIIDEVHAYDAYMSTLLERLLEWLAALSSPVILLSATLPKNRRNALIGAYQKGLGKVNKSDKPIIIGEDKYPRISYTIDEKINVKKLETSEYNKNRILYLDKTNSDFIEDLKEKLKDEGGCVAIICNTVKRSQELFELLSNDDFFKGKASDGKPKLDLLHARFRYIDRKAREDRCLERFGKPDKNNESLNRPDCAVLISTQIIEQSLDLDFDLMISDLAPIDLLLQRAGRLHRHKRKTRPVNLQKSHLWIIQPELNNENLPNFENSIVYDEHILLRTWLTLKNIDEIEIPKQIEKLIENVYDFEKAEENLSIELQDFWQKTLENCQKSIDYEKDEAENRYIKHPHYKKHISRIFRNNLEEDSPEIHKSLQAKTRLIEATISVICLWDNGDKIYLDEIFTKEVKINQKPNQYQTKQLLKRSINISTKSVVFELIKEEVPSGWQESALLRNHRMLVFNSERECEKFGFIFRLDKELGLQIIKKENANV